MLVSGVWRLWLTPRRKSSFAASSSSSWLFCASTCANSWAFRIATATSLANSSRRSWSARSHGRVAGRWPTSTPMLLARRAGGRPGPGSDSPGTRSSIGIVAGSTSRTTASIIPKAVAGVAARRGRPRSRRCRAATPFSIASRIRPSSRLRRSRSAGEAVVALGEAGQLVVAGHDDRGRQVAGRRPLDGRGDRPQRRGQVGGEEVGEQDRDDRRDRRATNRSSRAERSTAWAGDSSDEQDQPEAGERDQRGGDAGRS